MTGEADDVDGDVHLKWDNYPTIELRSDSVAEDTDYQLQDFER